MSDEKVLPENVTELRPVNKIDAKRAQIYQERRQRLLNQGIPPEKVDVMLAKEDWDRLPLDKKVERIVQRIGALQTQVSQDIQSLRYNEELISDVLDVNFRAMSKMISRLGIDSETQRQIIEQTQVEVRAELEARAAQQEHQSAEEILKDAETKKLVGGDEELEPVHIPDGATVFGD